MTIITADVPGTPAGAAALAAPVLTPRQRIRAIVAGSTGNLVEWYDFYAYAFTALYFAASFFPEADRTAQLLNVAGIYAIGFLARPIGGWFFGRYADRKGRRAAMLLSVLLMCGGSLLIACLPTYGRIGTAAPVLLLAARLLQGFSLGGEYGTSATYMSEVAIAGRRGFYSSFQYVTLIGGQLAAVLVVFVLQSAISEEALHAWGWRIPFLIGALLAVTALYLRRGMHETSPGAAASREAGTLIALLRHPRALWTVIALTAGGSLGFYTFTTYMQKFLVNTAGMTARTATGVMTLALLCFMLVQPLFGLLSDRIGRRTMLILWGLAGTVLTVPLLGAIGATPDPATSFLLIMAALLIQSFYTSISGLFKAELFPIEVRALGVGFSYAVANAVFGGSAEYVALAFKAAGRESGFYWYAAGMSALALSTALAMRDTRRHGTLRD
ncbi:MAG: MFS transporter [Novosphingobium sp.]|jgi:metabolite-proton symporter|nr:MFS transporter [Novosphingobium sp.]